MSRTNKGSKGSGYDYWSRRYGNVSGCNCPSGIGHSSTKRITRRAERRIAKQHVGRDQ